MTPSIRYARCSESAKPRTVSLVSSSSRRAFTVAMTVLAMFAIASCSNSDDPNKLERIDGPAQVDPDFGGLDDGTAVVVDDGANESESGG